MFTGIIETTAEVIDIVRRGDDAALGIRSPLLHGTAHGASVAINGVCLTVTNVDGVTDGIMYADVMGETLRCTTLGELRPRDAVNIERAMVAGARLDGHLVQGHVDDVAQVLSVTEHLRWTTVRFTLPWPLVRQVVRKGSVTVDGVSLTVADCSELDCATPWFEVGLIPTTMTVTTLGRLQPGQRVNVETDILGKYAERLLTGGHQSEQDIA